MDVRLSLTSLIRPPPFHSHSEYTWTDRHNFDDRCTRRLEWRRPDACTMLDGGHRHTGWPCYIASPPTLTASQCLLLLAPQPPVQSSSRGSTINRVPGTAPARHQVPLLARLMGAGKLTMPRSFPNDADHRAGWPPPPRYMGLIAGHWCLDRRPLTA